MRDLIDAQTFSILIRAVAIVAEMCRILRKEGRETWAKAWGEALAKLMSLALESLGGRTNVIQKEVRER